MMKTKLVSWCGLATTAATVILISGCVVEPARVRMRPVVVAPAPPEVAIVPDSYVWDGYEYVGVVGDQYYYLGPSHIWLRAEPFRLERFHGWERYHRDWHSHAIRNERYRGPVGRRPLPHREDRR